jgi:chemotaxis protein histidine kinase CheA
MTNKKDNIETLLVELQNNYLSELPSRFDEIDQLILDIKKQINTESKYATLYRLIHSIKGSAGTHNLHILTSICHHFEDLLSSVDSNLKNTDSRMIENWLKYSDLLRQTHNAIVTGGDLSKIEEDLYKLQAIASIKDFSCILVAPTKSQQQIFQPILQDNNIHYTIAKDGYQALGILLTARYDLVITNHEIDMLNGIALISALRMSSSNNKNIPTVLLTTNESIVLNRHNDPDYILIKNNHLAENMKTIITEIVETLNQPQP